MKLTPVKCDQCGASINVDSMPFFLKCSYCGTSYIADYQHNSSSNGQSVVSTIDKPINIRINQIDKPVIRADNFDLLDIKKRKELLYFIQAMSILSYYTNQEFICVTTQTVNCDFFYYSHDKKRTRHPVSSWGENVINSTNRRLVEWGFQVNGRWYKNSDEKIIERGMRYNKIGYTETYIMNGMIKITPLMRSTCWDEGLNDIVQRISKNDVCSYIADAICDEMIKKENYYIQNHVEGLCSYSFNVTQSSVDLGSKSFQFHSFGFNNLVDGNTYKAFCLCLLIKIYDRFNNHWMLSSGFTGRIEMTLETKLKKEYNNW